MAHVPILEADVVSTLSAHSELDFLGKLLNQICNHGKRRKSRHTFLGTNCAIFYWFAVFHPYKRMVLEFILQTEMRKTENE